MKWMLIVAGLLAAGTAVMLLSVWGKRSKTPKGEVSLMACVKRVFQDEKGTMMAVFVARGQEMRFSVPGDIGRQLMPGERGVLTYRGGEFVYFVPRQQMFENEEEGDDSLPAVS